MGVAEIIMIVNAVAVLIPVIIQIVKAIEEAVNQAKAEGTVTNVTGPEKKAAVLAVLQQFWPVISSTGTGKKIAAELTPEKIVEIASGLIDGIVSGLNSMGVFKKSQPPTTTPTA